MERNIDVSIILLTYNHASHVQQALDSILMQKTTAKYEILIHDDASTDGTREILKEYAGKYSCIKLFLRKEKSLNANRSIYQVIRYKAQGKYIAELEGDDYWIGEEKLETEYAFLENNLEYSAVYMDSITINEVGRTINGREHYLTYDWKGKYSIKDYWYSGKYPGQTGTMMGRNLYGRRDATITYKAHDVMGDISDIMLFAMEGPIYRINQVGSARRVVKRKGKDNWNSIAISRDVLLERAYARAMLLKYYERQTGNYTLVKERWETEYAGIKRHLLSSLSFSEFLNRGKVFFKVAGGRLNNRMHRGRI